MVAVSDPFGSFAEALTVLSAKDDWIEELKKIMDGYSATKLLRGPLRTGGNEGEAIHQVCCRDHQGEASVAGDHILG